MEEEEKKKKRSERFGLSAIDHCVEVCECKNRLHMVYTLYIIMVHRIGRSYELQDLEQAEPPHA